MREIDQEYQPGNISSTINALEKISKDDGKEVAENSKRYENVKATNTSGRTSEDDEKDTVEKNKRDEITTAEEVIFWN